MGEPACSEPFDDGLLEHRTLGRLQSPPVDDEETSVPQSDGVLNERVERHLRLLPCEAVEVEVPLDSAFPVFESFQDIRIKRCDMAFHIFPCGGDVESGSSLYQGIKLRKYILIIGPPVFAHAVDQTLGILRFWRHPVMLEWLYPFYGQRIEFFLRALSFCLGNRRLSLGSFFWLCFFFDREVL